MYNKLIYRLLLVLSVFVLPPSQQVFAADTAMEPASVLEMSQKININTASAEQFATINGIGTKKAQAIIDYRQEHGDFVSFEQLLDVKGIGSGTLKKIEPFLTL